MPAEPPSIEKISIWILEALDKEWRREPSPLKCRLASDVREEIRLAHKLSKEDMNRAIEFMMAPSRAYINFCNREDGQAMTLSDNGMTMMAVIEGNRLEEAEKKKWTRADKIALASLLLSVITFALGFFAGERAANKPDAIPIATQSTNLILEPVIPSSTSPDS